MGAIRVGVDGPQFTLNGKPTPLFTRSAFAVTAYLDRWASGWGPKWEDMVDQFFDRCKHQGFNGVRVFGETSGWKRPRPGNTISPFFSKYPTSDKMWLYEELWREQRPKRLTTQNQKVILKLIEKLQKHDLVCEYVTDATLKHDDVSAAMISQCIRQTARFLRHIEDGVLDFKVIEPSLVEKYSHLFSKDVNIFHELHNEWDAHNKAGLKLGELNMQFTRHRRYANAEPEQWPRGIVGVSHGGRNSVLYNVGRPHGADYVALHPERQGEWWKHTDLEKRYKEFPRYYNESKLYLSEEEWDRWVEPGVFSRTSGTKDLGKYIDFMEETIGNGISFCVHDVVGMQAGFTEENKASKRTKLEEYLGEAPPPPPPPPPIPKYRAKGKVKLFGFPFDFEAWDIDWGVQV
jgi:hypothetical protein